MVSMKSPHNRRKSLASTNQNKPPLAKAKRRHSVIGSSPKHKARRSLLAPRKSILKASLNMPFGDDSPPESESGSTSQMPNALADSVGATSMDPARDLHSNNTTRKSLGRRVSFVPHAYVRVIENRRGSKRKTEENQAPESTSSSVDKDRQEINERPPMNDENAYPGAPVNRHRRSSVRRSVGSEGGGEMSMDVDMNDTACGPSAFLQVSTVTGSVIADDDFDDDEDDDGEDMEMTEALRENIFRRRSLGNTSTRRSPFPPNLNVSTSGSSDHQDADRSGGSLMDDNTSSSLDTDSSLQQPVEYTIPLSKPLKKPGPPDEAWLALRRMTHSGDTPLEPVVSSDDEGAYRDGEDMDLDDAVRRLADARSSFSPARGDDIIEDSFSSMDNSLEERAGRGDETVNVTQMFRKASLARSEVTMEPTSVYGGVLDARISSIPTDPNPHTERAPSPNKQKFSNLTAIQLPSDATSSVAPSKIPTARKSAKVTIPQPFSFSFTPKTASTGPSNSRLASPSKAKESSNPNGSPKKQSQIPTAAFALPVVRPSPKKRPTTPTTDASVYEDNRPNPAKRLAMANKWVGVSSPSSNPAGSPVMPKPLSPSKKVPFQSNEEPAQAPMATSQSLRRPSGYFARRRSMLADSSIADDNGNTPANNAAESRHGRISLDNESAAAKNARLRPRELDVIQSRPAQQAMATNGHTRDSPKLNMSKPIFQNQEVPSSQPDIPAHPSAVVEEDSRVLGNAMQMDATERWREGVLEQDFTQDEDPHISIEQFLTMTGIKFMDEITAPRRSTHPSQMKRPPRNRRVSAGEIPLAEYVTATSIDIPQLKLYTRVSQDLQSWVEQSKDVYEQAEEEAAKLTPELFREYSQADEEGREQLLHQLHLMKAHSRGLAKSEWYDWKLGWINGLKEIADEGFAKLEADAAVLEEINKCASQIIPALEEEYLEVMRELELEQAAVAEIENGDMNYLNDLKASITEQNLEVETLRSEVSERTSQLQWLQERLDETEAQKREAKAAIAEANTILQIQKNSTSAEVSRLKDELEFLQVINMTEVTKVNANFFQYVYDSRFRVSLPCVEFVPVVKDIEICEVEGARAKSKDSFPELSVFWLHVAREQIARGGERTMTQVVQHLADYWISCSHIRTQLSLLAIKYVVSIEVIQPTSNTIASFKATASVLYQSKMAKALISFIFDQDTFSGWPMTSHSLKCEVRVAYGFIEKDEIYHAVTSRLAEARLGNSHACLLDACIEAMNVYQ